LFNWLDKNPRIQGIRVDVPYIHPGSLEILTSHPHKLDNTAAIYMDELLYNYSFAFPPLYQWCKFIYLVREARPTLNTIVSKPQSFSYKYSPESANKYYKYRLRRMCEMAKRTPKAILLTYDDLISGRKFPAIEKYLNLKEPIKTEEIKEDIQDVMDVSLINEAQESFERHLFYLKKFIHLCP